MSNAGYDYEKHIGETFGFLTVTGMAERSRDKTGHFTPKRYICQCECGRTVSPLACNVIAGRVLSCGCKHGLRLTELRQEVKRRGAKLFGRHSEPEMSSGAKARLELGATYYCRFPENSCVRSKTGHICCRECDKADGCENACQNTPDKCRR